MIKILWSIYTTDPEKIRKWKDVGHNEKISEGTEDQHFKSLIQWIEGLVDKGGWTIIAATAEYIILQKQMVDELMEKADTFFNSLGADQKENELRCGEREKLIAEKVEVEQ